MAEAAAAPTTGENFNLGAGAVVGGAVVSDPGAVFTEQSHLTYLVPAATNLELEDLFKEVEQGQSIIDSIKQRDSLFFGTRPYLLSPAHTRHAILTPG